MTLLLIGPIEFTLMPLNLQGTTKGGKVAFATHDVLGAAPVLEHTGYEAGSMTVEGIIVSRIHGNISSLAVIEAAKEGAVPLPVTRGDFTPMGWYVIEESEEKHTDIDGFGAGGEIAVTMKLKRVGTPSVGMAGAIFSLAFDGISFG